MSADYRMPRQWARFTRPVFLSAGDDDGRARNAHDGPSGRSTHGAAPRYSARLWRTEGCTLIVYFRQENVRKISTVKCKALIDSGRSTRCAPFVVDFFFRNAKQAIRAQSPSNIASARPVGGRFGGRSRRSNVRRKARANGWNGRLPPVAVWLGAHAFPNRKGGSRSILVKQITDPSYVGNSAHFDSPHDELSASSKLVTAARTLPSLNRVPQY